jgi:hypothetical protein
MKEQDEFRMVLNDQLADRNINLTYQKVENLNSSKKGLLKFISIPQLQQ